MKIHPSAIVSSQAQLGRDITVGPFCIIESDVTVGDGCILEARVSLKSGTTLGEHNWICEGTVLGGLPQHVRIPDHPGTVVIGSHNTFRENVTVHRALHADTATVIGDHCLIMAGGHVAHDCHMGHHIIFANNSLLAGHVTVDDRAYISGAVGVHQFCRIGRLAMIGGHARVVQDVPPFMTVDGTSGCVVGLNSVGLRRNGFNVEQVTELKEAYRTIYRRGLKWSEVIERLSVDFASDTIAYLRDFLSGGKRGFVQERRLPPHATLKLRQDNDADAADVRRKAG